MVKIKEKYLVNAKGKAVGVFIDIKEYRRILKKIEELDSIRAYDTAKASRSAAIPFEQAVKEIERKRWIEDHPGLRGG